MNGIKGGANVDGARDETNGFYGTRDTFDVRTGHLRLFLYLRQRLALVSVAWVQFCRVAKDEGAATLKPQKSSVSLFSIRPSHYRLPFIHFIVFK